MIKILDNILTMDECLELIKNGSNKLIKSSTLGENIDGYRTAENCWIFDETFLTNKIKNIIVKETDMSIDNQEKIHIVKYDIGGEYKQHHDFFHPNTDYYSKVMQSGGQRVYSCLFYLNDDFEGGETEFVNKNIKINPKTGRLLIWKNIKENGSLDYDSFHAGLPVISGTKWIAIIWVREDSFEKKIIKKEITSICFDFSKLLENSECEIYKKIVLDAKDNGLMQLETDKRYYNNSYGAILPFLWELMDRFRPLVENVINKKIKNANPYIRIYQNGSTLNSHTDRDGLDYTISLCIFENINKEWPLKVKTENGDVIEYPTKTGYASLVSGNILQHWREPLQCGEGQFVIQLFLHYEDI
jgi:prolyl 4-hydroxylase